MIFYILYGLPGHSSTLQVSTEVEDPEHSTPSWAASVFLSLMFVLSPPPHVFEHSPICHAYHSQSTKVNCEMSWSKYHSIVSTIRFIIPLVLTWTFLNVAALSNIWGSRTFFAAMRCFHFPLPWHGHSTPSTCFRAFAGFPIIPYAIN